MITVTNPSFEASAFDPKRTWPEHKKPPQVSPRGLSLQCEYAVIFAESFAVENGIIIVANSLAID